MLSYSPFTLIYYEVGLKFIGEYLLYSVVLVCSKVNQMYMCIHISPLFWISFPARSPQSPEYSSLCCIVGSH